ncbi:hypothetical protein ACRE_081250 [Hapsidospora chrysogenum ATCC 11550]|uniref:DNA mismatch repair protein S5 domain-containing protein n=1 Tax=Hapsidospora chrysogenum (strain ATCC 11550 / CBS 779.69 / DSM 880 / IAM 14645 / JCM 23072 / IMI 49137) TaxID=857340 RepID=A0A086SVP8_HAPC1|nr:hypothetical protein ACRE_081250 [Hapsidospora chrysogenum ATCC 11550]
MTISRLPPDTIRLLGSSCTISTPSSVVKELVDNSIDAGATSVEIIIASNTVEKIQISDNGCGISTDDFAAVGCRASTSKLRSFEELTRGTKTLGFRGEALAAVNSVAENVTIKTRTADPGAHAQEFKLHPGVGGAVDPQVAAGPVGTTITVERLFGGIPVRRQHAVKAARKTIAQIKDLLLAYAFARPQLKISLKVPWEPGRAWGYHPSPKNNEQGKGGLGVALQMFGHKFSSECVFVDGKRTLESRTNQHGNSQARVVTLQALMPSPDCKADVVKGKGAFISVDSRPITSTRGTAKKIASLLRSYLGRTKNGAKFKPQSNPFLWLDIECPPGNYDPNIAPLKDEVLFTDEKAVLNCFEDLCRRVYKEAEPPAEVEEADYVQYFQHTSFSKDAETASSSATEKLPQELIINQAHTRRKMNVAREESDSTDDNDAEEATVPAPSKFVQHTPRDPKLHCGVGNLQAHTTGQIAQGIHQFFPPHQEVLRERSRSNENGSESEEDLRLFLSEPERAGLEDPSGPDAITRQSLNKCKRSRSAENEPGSDEGLRMVHNKRKQHRIVEAESDSDPLRLLLNCVGGVSGGVSLAHAVELTKLPLETVRGGTGTWDITTTLDCFNTAGSQTWHWIGRSVDAESETSMLDFEDMADVTEVGDRLKRVADEWVAKQNGEVIVVYSLHRHATGKHKVC